MKAGWLAGAPRDLPSLAMMVEDLAADALGVAAFLGVDASTVRKWISRGGAPRPASLALFYETRWGRSHVHCRAENTARLHEQLAGAYRRQADALAASLGAVVAIGDFGTANDPTLAVLVKPGDRGGTPQVPAEGGVPDRASPTQPAAAIDQAGPLPGRVRKRAA